MGQGWSVSAVAVAGRLRTEKEYVLQEWLARARAEISAARHQDEFAIRASLPVVLDTLAEALESPSPEEALSRVAGRIAAEHAQQRAGLVEYSLDQVVFEYQILREVLFRILEQEQPLPPVTRDLLLDAIQASVRNAAREFVDQRQIERDRARVAVNDANAALEQRVLERTAELSRSEERFRTMVDVVKDYAIFTIDPQGFITTWNTGAERMKGHTVAEAIGAHFSMLYPEEGNRRDEPMSHLRTAAIEGRFRGEGLRLRKNGDHFIADVSIAPMYERSVLTGFSKVVQDLTERNLLMQERDLTRTQARSLEAEVEYRKRVVATITHDLRTPLSAAKSAAYLITRMADDTDQVRTLAVRITDAVDRSDRMISDLLDASRLEVGQRLSLRFSLCDLRAIVEQTCHDLATRHGNRFVIHTEGDTTGFWSSEGLRRILDNLLSNALKYGDPMGPITIRLHRVDDRLLLVIHNLGTIIPVEEQQQLFQPFHRTRMAQMSDKRGWGLGLTLVKGIVDAHHGVVKVESYPLDGTTFTVDLPIDARREEREDHPEAAS